MSYGEAVSKRGKMTNELEILKSVESKNTVTQRELAKRTGLSLGAVNVLIKRLIQKGLLKIEQINARTIRYILTPKGMMEKARLTYKYIIISYNYIADIENRIEQILSTKNKASVLVLYGEKDELYEIIISKLYAMNEPYRYIDEWAKLKDYVKEEYIIITWNPNEIETEQEKKDKCINILRVV
jgi:DNA-binding MarR family transcriptional regulator